MTQPLVIKFGGEIVESREDLANLVSSVKSLYEQNNQIILVHGGGPLATKLSKQMGLVPEMVGGRRVTNSETLDVMKMVLPGIINSNVLGILKKSSLPAISSSGISFIRSHKRPPKAVSGSDGKVVDFGFVGDIDEVDPTQLNWLLEGDFIPVVSPLTCDQNGTILNTNADTVAVQIAKACKASKLVLITKVGGVYQDINDNDSRFSSLTKDQAKKLIENGIIQGGMIPKLEEGFKLLSDQLESFHIVGTDTPETLANELSRPGSMGTAIIR